MPDDQVPQTGADPYHDPDREKSARNQWKQNAQRVTFTRAKSAKRTQNGPLAFLRTAGGQEAAGSSHVTRTKKTADFVRNWRFFITF